MIPDDVPDLPADVALLLADAKTLRGPSAEARARLRSRLPLPPPPSPPGGGNPSGGDAAPSGPSPSAAVGGASAGAAGAASALPKVPLWGAALLFAAGVGVGVFGMQLRSDPPVAREAASPSTVVSALVVATTTAVKVPSVPSASAPITVALADLPNVDVAPARPGESVKPEPGASLAAERALLDVARTALGRGDGPNASAACAEHARKYPNGSLVEEREAIAIQALVLEGRKEDATQRAGRFRTRHPRSILLPAVLASVGLSE